MTTSFEILKSNRSASFEYIRSLDRPNLGVHRKTRLSKAGCSDCGSLLDTAVADNHCKLLYEDFRNLFNRDQSNSQEHLRFLTVLHAVVELDVDVALQSAILMEHRLVTSMSDLGLACIGVVELEIVNLALLRNIASRTDAENRKLDVLERLMDGSFDIGLLIHFHGVVDLSNSILRSDELRDHLLTNEQWRRSNYQVELKQFYGTRSVTSNLDAISAYLVKGGNETLRYNTGFGRDPDAELDAQVWRGKSGRADRGADTVTDDRALSYSEIRILNDAWLRLMQRTPDNRGYVLRIDKVA